MSTMHRYWYRAEHASGIQTFFAEITLIVDNGITRCLAMELPQGGTIMPNGMGCSVSQDDVAYVCDTYLRLLLEDALRKANVLNTADPIASLVPVHLSQGERPYGFYEKDFHGDIPAPGTAWPVNLIPMPPKAGAPEMPHIAEGDCSL